MTVTESTTEGDHVVRITLSARRGDRSRIVERNNDRNDVPLLIAYNLGVDFDLRTWEARKERVMGLLKNLRVIVNEVMEDLGGQMGAKPPDLEPPPKSGGLTQ